MTTTRARHGPARSDTLGLDLAAVNARLQTGGRIRRTLRPWGRLFIDHPVPFLCVYRRPEGAANVPTEELVTGEASYLLVPGEASLAREVGSLVRSVAGALAGDFGACLILELSRSSAVSEPGVPLFRIVQRRGEGPASTIDALEAALSQIRLPEFQVDVDIVTRSKTAPMSLPSLLGDQKYDRDGFFVLGLEIRPIYLDSEGDKEYPIVHRRLRRSLSRALKQAAFEFTTRHTLQRPSHYQALGRRTFVKAVRLVDAGLAEASNQFDLLLLTTPRNADQAWAKFRASHFDRVPRFSYPPRTFDPVLAKRRLFQIPVEHVEDPTLAELFRQQQDELDRKITMVADRGSPRFKYEGLQLFGTVNDQLLGQAERLLDRIPSRARESSTGGQVDTRAFVARAEEELAFLRQQCPQLKARVQVRDEVSGLMVSRGCLLVPGRLAIPASRVEALLQHEIGTHVVTYYNGDAQPFRQLRNGLPGYEELQEGLAVLAEFLVGGLSRPRLRVLAARVVAVRRMIDGASFIDVFRELDRDYDLAQRAAFTITMRVFRGGGQSKDAVYLRGFLRMLEYIAAGGTLEPLFVGKIGFAHLPMMRDLERRQVLVHPPLQPRYLGRPETDARLERLRGVVDLIDLVTTDGRSAT